MSYANGPKIVTDGLVLCLDAANRKSYPGSGSTWTDLSGNGNHGTLINGTHDPIYSSQGYFDFDGSNDGIQLAGSSSLSVNHMTIVSWNYSSSYYQNGFMFEKTTNNVVNTQYSMFYNVSGGSVRIYYRTYGLSITDAVLIVSSNGYINENSWNQVVCTYDGASKKIYTNSVLRSTTNVTGTVTQNSTGRAYVGIYGSFNGYPFNGNISVTQLYNRALSADEIRQNYNALKGRYGLT